MSSCSTEMARLKTAPTGLVLPAHLRDGAVENRAYGIRAAGRRGLKPRTYEVRAAGRRGLKPRTYEVRAAGRRGLKPRTYASVL